MLRTPFFIISLNPSLAPAPIFKIHFHIISPANILKIMVNVGMYSYGTALLLKFKLFKPHTPLQWEMKDQIYNLIIA